MGSDSSRNGEYHEGLLWFSYQPNLMTVGITSRAVDELGTPSRIRLPNVGESFESEDAVAAVDGSRMALEVIAPVGGTVIETNEELHGQLNVLVEDPTEEGWLVKLEIEDPSELQNIDEG